MSIYWTADNGRRLLIVFPARFRETVEGLMKCRGPVSKTVTRLETDNCWLTCGIALFSWFYLILYLWMLHWMANNNIEDIPEARWTQKNPVLAHFKRHLTQGHYLDPLATCLPLDMDLKQAYPIGFSLSILSDLSGASSRIRWKNAVMHCDAWRIRRILMGLWHIVTAGQAGSISYSTCAANPQEAWLSSSNDVKQTVL